MADNNIEYPANSKNPGVPTSNTAPTPKSATAKPTAEKPKAAPVASGRTKKRSGVDKAARKMNIDGGKIKDYMLGEVLIPTIKETLWSILTGGLSMVLFDGSKGPSTRTGSGSRFSTTKVSYNGFYRGERTERESRVDRYSRKAFVANEVIDFDTRAEAEAVIDALSAIIDDYGFASLADFYDAACVTAPPTYNRYGWRSIRDFCTRRTRDGWIIDYPDPIVL